MATLETAVSTIQQLTRRRTCHTHLETTAGTVGTIKILLMLLPSPIQDNDLRGCERLPNLQIAMLALRCVVYILVSYTSIDISLALVGSYDFTFRPSANLAARRQVQSVILDRV